jgi:HAD superfamily hydrolase (TIGR01509 family)
MRRNGSLKKRTTEKKLVIFDLDGTLIDAYRAVEESLNFTLRRLGYKQTAAATKVRRSVGWGETHLLRCFVRPGDLEQAAKIYRRHHPESLRRGTKLLPGAIGILRHLKSRGYLLAVASNRATKFSRLVVRHLRIAKYFDLVLCRDRVPRPKPFPDILHEILRQLDVRPSEAVFVGDMVVDIQAGKRAGIDTVGVITGSCTAGEIRALKPVALIRNILALKKVFEKYF